MIRLILLRHGNTFETGQTPTQIGARTDLPLTAQGRLQAQQAAQFFAARKIRPAALYRGALKRQAETAQIIGQELKLSDRIEPALMEIDYGLWEGLTSSEIGARWPQEYADWTEEAKWAEGIFDGSRERCIQAIEGWLARLRRIHEGETVIGVSSNGLIRFFYSFLREEWQRTVQKREMDQFKVKTGHFCELFLIDDRVEIKSWNRNPLNLDN